MDPRIERQEFNEVLVVPSASQWFAFLLLHEIAKGKIQICFDVEGGGGCSTYQGRYSETEPWRVETNPTWTRRKALARPPCKQEICIRA